MGRVRLRTGHPRIQPLLAAHPKGCAQKGRPGLLVLRVAQHALQDAGCPAPQAAHLPPAQCACGRADTAGGTPGAAAPPVPAPAPADEAGAAERGVSGGRVSSSTVHAAGWRCAAATASWRFPPVRQQGRGTAASPACGMLFTEPTALMMSAKRTILATLHKEAGVGVGWAQGGCANSACVTEGTAVFHRSNPRDGTISILPYTQVRRTRSEAVPGPHLSRMPNVCSVCTVVSDQV